MAIAAIELAPQVASGREGNISSESEHVASSAHDTRPPEESTAVPGIQPERVRHGGVIPDVRV